MRILVTGGDGFIGTQIVTDLLAAGYEIICCGRNLAEKQLQPGVDYLAVDFSQVMTREQWQEKLQSFQQIDVLVNCVGVLQAKKKTTWNVHYHAPKALIDMLMTKGLKKIIQISALGIDSICIPFASSKKALDDYLMTLPLTVMVFRPSLVYGSGSYGGTSLFRGLAGLPGFIVLPRNGEAKFQPIHIEDLSRSVLIVIKRESLSSQIIYTVGPKQYSMYQIIVLIRYWLRFGKAIKISIPMFLTKWLVRLGDLCRTTINSTMFKMLQQNNIASPHETLAFQDTVGFVPRSFKQGLYSHPSYVQDRWHSRLYFLKPLLRLSIGALWLFTGLTSLFFYPEQESLALLNQVGVKEPWIFLYASSLLDVLLGLSTLFKFRLRFSGSVQIGLMVIYTLIITFRLPYYWLDPFGPVTKNIPLLVATAIMIALESKR